MCIHTHHPSGLLLARANNTPGAEAILGCLVPCRPSRLAVALSSARGRPLVGSRPSFCWPTAVFSSARGRVSSVWGRPFVGSRPRPRSAHRPSKLHENGSTHLIHVCALRWHLESSTRLSVPALILPKKSPCSSGARTTRELRGLEGGGGGRRSVLAPASPWAALYETPNAQVSGRTLSFQSSAAYS